MILLQQVNKIWRDTITSSITLRRRLFLSPDNRSLNTMQHVRWNPFLFHTEKILPSPYEHDKPFDLHTYRLINAQKLKELYLNQSPWLDMFMTQPPVRKVRLWHGEAKNCGCYGSTYVENEGGVTFADLDSLPVTIEIEGLDCDRKSKVRERLDAMIIVHLQ